MQGLIDSLIRLGEEVKTFDDANRHTWRCTMKQGRRKFSKGVVLFVLSTFLLTQTGLAGALDLIQDPRLPDAGQNPQMFDVEKRNDTLNPPADPLQQPLEKSGMFELTSASGDRARRTVTRTEFSWAAFAGTLLIMGRKITSTAWDEINKTFATSVTNITSKYRGTTETRRTGNTVSESTNTVTDEKTISNTKLTFEYLAVAADFVVTLQRTKSVSTNPGSLREDKYLTDDNGNQVLDADGNPILWDAAASDDITKSDTTTIKRSYNDATGKLTEVTGTTTGKEVGGGVRTDSKGVLIFGICQNTECLKEQVVTSRTRDSNRGEVRESVSTYKQEVSAKGEILSAQQISESTLISRKGFKGTETSTSVQNFDITEGNTVAPRESTTTSVTVDLGLEGAEGNDGRQTTSTQKVTFKVDLTTGKILSAEGTIESQTVSMVDGQASDPNSAAYLSNMHGETTFEVSRDNRILQTRMETFTHVQDNVNDMTSEQHQLVTNHYDPVTGYGTTGNIHSDAVTITTGELDFNCDDGTCTHFDAQTGQWDIVVNPDGTADGAVTAVSQADILTVAVAGGEFVPFRSVSVNSSFNEVTKEFTTNTIFTRYLYHANGNLDQLQAGYGANGYGTTVDEYDSDSIDPTIPGINSDDKAFIEGLMGMSSGDLINALRAEGTGIRDFYFDSAFRPIQLPYSRINPVQGP